MNLAQLCLLCVALLGAYVHTASSHKLKLPGDFQYVRCVNEFGNTVFGGLFTDGTSNTFAGVCPILIIAGGKFDDDVTLLCDSASDSLTVRLISVVDEYNAISTTTTVLLPLSSVGKIQGDVRGGDDRWESRNAKGGACTGTEWPKMHIDGGRGNDVLQSGSNNDTLFGNHGIDVLIARDGNDVVWTGSGKTYADGGDGNDYVRGAGDNDFMFGGKGRDTVVSFGQSDLVTGDVSALGKYDGVQILAMLVELDITAISFDTTVLSTFLCDDLTADRLLLRRRRGAGFDIIVRGACSTPGTDDCALDSFDIMDGAPQRGDLLFNGTFAACATLLPPLATLAPTTSPTQQPTDAPTKQPTAAPSSSPTQQPTDAPTSQPTDAPSATPTSQPTGEPTTTPTKQPTNAPSESPTQQPTNAPTAMPVAPVTKIISTHGSIYGSQTIASVVIGWNVPAGNNNVLVVTCFFIENYPTQEVTQAHIDINGAPAVDMAGRIVDHQIDGLNLRCWYHPLGAIMTPTSGSITFTATDPTPALGPEVWQILVISNAQQSPPFVTATTGGEQVDAPMMTQTPHTSDLLVPAPVGTFIYDFIYAHALSVGFSEGPSLSLDPGAFVVSPGNGDNNRKWQRSYGFSDANPKLMDWTWNYATGTTDNTWIHAAIVVQSA